MDDYRICPACRTEYTLRARNCADCGAILAWPSQAAATASIPVSDDVWDDVVPGQVMGQLAVDTQTVIEAYLGHLRKAGIKGAVLPQTEYQPGDAGRSFSPGFASTRHGGQAGQTPVSTLDDGFIFLLFVRREDYESAERIIDGAFAQLHPGDDGGLHREYQPGTCPACQAAVPEGATECPDCELTLG